MEFAAVGLVLRVVPLAVDVLTSLYKYYGNVAEAPGQVLRLRQELGTVIAILNTLKDTLDCSPTGFKGSEKVLEEGLVQFEALLKEMEVRVQDHKARGFERLRWPFKEETNKEYLEKIERHKSSFILALTLENHMTAQETAEGIREIQSATRVLHSNATAQLSDFEELLNWLCPAEIDPQDDLERRREITTKQTGNWIFHDPAYRQWIFSQGSFLWLYGLMGSGKSMLAYSQLVRIADFRSSVIYKLTKATRKSPNAALAYFYCDGSSETKQDPRRIFGSLFRQLLTQTSNCTKATAAFMASVTDFYKRNKYRDFGIRTRLESLVNYLISTSGFFEDLTIVIDGLDECSPRNTLLAMIEKLAQSNIRLLVTSRPEIDIEEKFAGYPTIQMDPVAMETDIRKHIDSRMQSDRKLSCLSDALKEEIKRELMSKHGGMYIAHKAFPLTCRFRWVECQLDTVSRYRSDAKRRAAITKLPRGLDATYSRILNIIQDQSDEDLKLACKAITWVLFAHRTLMLEELAIMVGINPNEEFTEDQRLNENDIVELCSSFIKINGHGEVEIAHFSVVEFFTTPKFEKDTVNRYYVDQLSGHSLLLASSLTLLSSPFFREWVQTVVECSTLDLYSQFPYAVHYWRIHAKQCDVDNDVRQGVVKFLLSPAYEDWSYYLRCSVWAGFEHYTDDLALSPGRATKHPSCQAAAFGLTNVLLDIISQNGGSNTTSKETQDLFWEAIEGGHPDLVAALLNHGVDPTAGSDCTALDVAVAVGDKDTAQILLNYQPLNGLKPIHKIEWISLFNSNHDLGCDIEFVNALIRPANDKYMVEFQTSYGRTGLHEAILRNRLDTVKLLLDAGISDINAQDNDNSTPLHYAANFRHSVELADLLISYHADRTLKDELGRTPLDVTFYSKNNVLFRHLLELTYPDIAHQVFPVASTQKHYPGVSVTVDYSKFEICYRQLAQKEPDNPVYPDILGEILFSLGSIPDALSQFDLAFTLCCLAQHEKCTSRIKTPSRCRLCHRILGRSYKCTAGRCKTVCSSCARQVYHYRCSFHETKLVAIPSIECLEKLQLTCVDIPLTDHTRSGKCSGSDR